MPNETPCTCQENANEFFEFLNASKIVHTRQKLEKRLEQKQEDYLRKIKRSNARTMSFIVGCATVVSGVMTSLVLSLYFEANNRMHEISSMRMGWLEKTNEELRKTAEAQNRIISDMLEKWQERRRSHYSD